MWLVHFIAAAGLMARLIPRGATNATPEGGTTARPEGGLAMLIPEGAGGADSSGGLFVDDVAGGASPSPPSATSVDADPSSPSPSSSPLLLSSGEGAWPDLSRYEPPPPPPPPANPTPVLSPAVSLRGGVAASVRRGFLGRAFAENDKEKDKESDKEKEKGKTQAVYGGAKREIPRGRSEGLLAADSASAPSPRKTTPFSRSKLASSQSTAAGGDAGGGGGGGGGGSGGGEGGVEGGGSGGGGRGSSNAGRGVGGSSNGGGGGGTAAAAMARSLCEMGYSAQEAATGARLYSRQASREQDLSAAVSFLTSLQVNAPPP